MIRLLGLARAAYGLILLACGAVATFALYCISELGLELDRRTTNV